MALGFSATRKLLNHLIDNGPNSLKKRVHGGLGLIFEHFDGTWANCAWHVTFAGKTLQIPLDSQTLHADWVTAVTLLGHDLEEKETYKNVLNSSFRPDVFLDIGGNQGTHSLMMMAHGIRTIYVEPNSRCHVNFARYCRRNDLTCELVQCAMGNSEGHETLFFPEHQTWLGTTQPELIRNLGTDHRLIQTVVERSTVDKLTEGISTAQMVIKIDAEGAERQILAGAAATISRLRPLFLFEVHRDRDKRAQLFDFFSDIQYGLSAQPWRVGASLLSLELFVAHTGTNFIAAPVLKH